MQVSQSTKLILSAIPLAILPFSLSAHSDGAPTRVTAAPGDDPMACTQCHSGTLNSGPGSLTIAAASGTVYTPGVKQRIKVTIADPAARRWGFSLSPRVASSAASGRAGTLSTVDNLTRVFCDGDTPAPCRDENAVEFITHTTRGTRAGTTATVDFEFEWTPPANDVGTVTLYAAANSANGNGAETGDRIYSAKLDLTPGVAGPAKPSISSDKGVLNAATLQSSIGANTWFTIAGTGLAATAATWDAEKFEEKKLPVVLEGVSVTVNGKDAYIQSVSPEKITVLGPADDAQGEVQLVVKSAGTESDPVKIKLDPFAPGVFTHDGKFVVVTRGEDKPIDRPEQIPAKDKDAATAKAGEKITLYGTGLGATDPETPAGKLAEAEAPAKAPVTVNIGGTDAVVEFAGIRAGAAAIYQIVVTVPEGLADGDHRVIVQAQDIKSPEAEGCCFLKVKN